ncbi:type VI secretion system-associated FHA domain protein TagH [uncultured Paracoccus sp.]|uniref:type VI secretion system-associated FHA domain protein TagH n=1 Tax=uncultured Paracoccus sp. TaxID=189685 RepID=UPI0025DB43D9|nr:type VI secretion system-associated FHA domain protein TagH [uncultured Paracoccus sp.]
MALTLLIENYQVLDDGGPASIEVPEAGLQVGRRPGMGWVLPDASRHISGHHFDVYFQGGEWWLRDLSTNGTFLQGMRHRLDGPHKLEHGDRFQVGQYIVVALMDAQASQTGMRPTSLPSYDGPVFAQETDEDPWSLDGMGGLPPVDPLPPAEAPSQPDFAQDFLAFPQHHESVSAPPAPANPLPESPVPAAAVPPVSAPPSAMADQGPAFLRAFCEGAGLPPELAAGVAPEDLGRALGQAMRAATSEVMLALRDRASAKQFVRVGERTMRGAEDNNPLKFLPDPDQAIEAMFLRPRAGFQTGAAGFDEALRDMRQHQSALFAALQPALMKLVGDLAPEAIEAASDGGRFGTGRKTRAWDEFVRRWDAKTAPHENGILDEFVSHFASAYRDAAGASHPKRG